MRLHQMPVGSGRPGSSRDIANMKSSHATYFVGSILHGYLGSIQGRRIAAGRCGRKLLKVARANGVVIISVVGVYVAGNRKSRNGIDLLAVNGRGAEECECKQNR